ncbi:alanine/glycine:cation symporter family protein [Meiothermus ruber]|jgi:AGCS family alanine or glycine:cation symporter|uniref:Amino acid carrier protein n=1 Tax=Meiothermus ruber (strain ATCC 35948 / DSM 1279 / VKM B-1258 / 21) TaxID=504728 RepID=D3PMQ2_MEIRD|nr:amino acid carrier protein [Meiothermus ruber]ADD27227.1 amino acid carrier protein [Meiothermus ruber DSM 1279]AGK03679.1 amino acid carrier protein [Meiothermus ruber DSM 1279]MCL6530005.1 amino acid carrier protein [Meiothermus ruber]
MDILTLNDYVNRAVYGEWMMLVFILVGLYLSLRTGFPQLLRLGVALRETLGAIRERFLSFGGQITPFQAAMVAMSATIGTGHIIGMVGAVVLGGPGAVLWMWVAYLVGMATKFSEAVLAVHFRRQYTDGSVLGGPMVYIRYGLGRRMAWLAALFALFTAIAAFGIGNLSQSGAVGAALAQEFNVPPAVTGLLVALLVGILLAGGIRSVARFAQMIVPLKLVLFLLAILPLIVIHLESLPAALALVFSSALSFQAAAGGAAGAAVSLGLAEILKAGVGRGIFANEAGLGSAAIAHAQAQVDHPVRQGFWGLTEMLLSLTVTTLMALTFIASGLWQRFLGGDRVEAARALFAEHPLGVAMLGLMLAVFALGTMVSWGFYGEEGAAYLFGEGIRWPYRLTFVTFAFVGPMGGLAALTSVADTLNGLMAIPNLVALLALGGLVGRLVREFFSGMPWQPPEED